ncbi:hypothetical protein [Nocardiopsis potens]|uniref:hypothetical protein n=1 Tax=Nocardiopsis potens TaxID=1246458 RepID=UPI001F4CCC75|nr:hypothetical protein [Nocardiopsis potens]
MASSAGHPGPVSPGTYWKRRVFVLVGLLAIVTLIVYACGPSSSEEEPTGASASAEPSASPDSEDPTSVPPSASPSPSPSASSDSDDAGSGGSGGGEGGDGGGKKDGDGGGEDSGSSSEFPAPKKASDACRPSDVVLTLESDRSDYAWDGEPELEISAVNLGDQTCTVDLGPNTVELLIKSGDDRVYSTADCAEAKDTEKVELERGVPGRTTVEWDRTRSWKDCRESQQEAKRPGTYVAELKGDYASGSEKEQAVFRLN